MMSSGLRQPLTKAFLDDTTITTKTVIEVRWALRGNGNVI